MFNIFICCYFFKNLGVAGMVFHGVKQTEYYMNFFRLLTMLTELPGAGGPPGTEEKKKSSIITIQAKMMISNIIIF